MAASATLPSTMEETLESCPFCGFHAESTYIMLLHVEEQHAEGQSPFVVRDQASTGSDSSFGEKSYAQCPVDGCEEILAVAELDDHLDLHIAEQDPRDDAREYQASAPTNGYRSPYSNSGGSTPATQASTAPRASSRTSHAKNRSSGSIQRWRQIFGVPSAAKRSTTASAHAGEPPRKRLGKSELGKYAHEDAMPDWLRRMLHEKNHISQGGMIPVLAQVLDQNPTTRYAFLCSAAVHHVSKLKNEGGFCGYRNIQMLSSYIIGAGADGAAHFNGTVPSIFQIQEYIETAWDHGINKQGRVETGGVRGTRKYIGTPEAQAVFLDLAIPCEAVAFKDPRPGCSEIKLLRYVEDYFTCGDFDPERKVRCTSMPPIYFQHRGHSLTIVGLEKRVNGDAELLVFDPVFRDPDGLTKLVDSGARNVKIKSPDNTLKLYRRGNRYLKRFHEFELLKLTSRPPTAAVDNTY